MTEAVNSITQYAFKQLGMKRLSITCDVFNERSKKIAERLGFKLEATLKANRIQVNGEVSDTLVFARYDLKGLPDLLVTW
jgi:ribosomal-protein-serine acetyltransferase